MLELAGESDWEAVNRLSVQIHDLHADWRPDIYFSCSEPYPKERFLKDIQNRMVYVAKADGVVVGYVVLSVLQKGGPGVFCRKELRLDSICVDEAVRDQGIGSAVVFDVRALAPAFGCRSLVLGVHPENAAGMAFYKKCGFQLRTVNMEINLTQI